MPTPSSAYLIHPPHPTEEWTILYILFSNSLFPLRHNSPCQHMCTCCMLSHFSHVQFCVTPWTAACQAPLSVGFPRKEYWSGLPCPSPGDLHPPRDGTLLSLPALAGGFFTTSTTWEACVNTYSILKTSVSGTPHFSCREHEFVGELKVPHASLYHIPNVGLISPLLFSILLSFADRHSDY